MKPRDTCPTCGTALGPLHDKDTLQRCSSCARVNPRGFYYCGYCAAPMESTDHRAELAEVAAPPGGWPSLARELVEVQFFVDRGELDEAFERIAILRERYPGHPELVELQREPNQGRPRPDTQVNRIVDSVLSSSTALSDPLPRRAAPKWKAPAAGEGAGEDGRTRAHEVVSPVSDGKRPVVRKSVARPGKERQAGSFPAISKATQPTDARGVVPPSRPAPRPRVKVATDRHAGAAPVPRPGATPVQQALASLARDEDDEATEPRTAPEEARSGEATAAPGLTVAVSTLQPPAPFREPDAGAEGPPQPRARSGVRKRALKARKRSGVHQTVDEAPSEAEPRRRRVRGLRFGQHVLGRLGGKDDD